MSVPANGEARCVCCAERKPDLGLSCSRCHNLARTRLTDLLEFYALTEGELLPGRGGSRSSGRGLGLRLDALDFTAGHDVLPRLEMWEREWREARHLSAQPGRGNLAGLPNAVATLLGVVDFLLVHLEWAYAEHLAVDEFHGDLGMLHAQARNAARISTQSVTVITCPADGGQDGRCGHELVLHDIDLEANTRCDGCRSVWSVRRLLLVAAADTESEVWVAEDDVALLQGVAASTLRKWAKAGKVTRKRGMYELGSVRAEIVVALAEGRFRGERHAG